MQFQTTDLVSVFTRIIQKSDAYEQLLRLRMNVTLADDCQVRLTSKDDFCKARLADLFKQSAATKRPPTIKTLSSMKG